MDPQLRTSAQVVERMAMGGQNRTDTLQLTDAIQRIEKRQQWIFRAGDTGNVWRNGWQYMISGKENTRLRIMQAEVIRRVPGRVLHEHLTIRQMQHIALSTGWLTSGTAIPPPNARITRHSSRLLNDGRGCRPPQGDGPPHQPISVAPWL